MKSNDARILLSRALSLCRVFVCVYMCFTCVSVLVTNTFVIAVVVVAVITALFMCVSVCV